MKNIGLVLLAGVELVIGFFLGRPAGLNALRVAYTRKEVLMPNAAYFAGMLFGDLLRAIIVGFLVWHVFRIVKTLKSKTSNLEVGQNA